MTTTLINDFFTNDIYHLNTANASQLSSGDFVMLFDIDTLPTSPFLQIWFRIKNKDNHWSIAIHPDGILYLRQKKRSAWTDKEVGTTTLAGGERIMLVTDGSTIEAWIDSTKEWSHTSSDFSDESYWSIDSLAGGAISDHDIYYRNLPTQLTRILNQYSNNEVSDKVIFKDTFSNDTIHDFEGDSERNGIIRFTVDTLPSSDNIEFNLRMQDYDNKYRLQINSSGDLDLSRIDSGSPTSVDSAAGVVTNGENITIIFDGTTINVYSDSTQDINYTGATSYTQETGWQLRTLGTGGAVSALSVYNRDITGNAQVVLKEAIEGNLDSYEFSSDFAEDISAPIGSRALTQGSMWDYYRDTGENLSVTSNGLEFLGVNTAWTDPILAEEVTRTNGRAYVVKCTIGDSLGGNVAFGFNTVEEGGISTYEIGIEIETDGALHFLDGADSTATGLTVSANDSFYLAMVLNSTGAFLAEGDPNTGVWRLMWHYVGGVTSTLYANIAVGAIGNIYVEDVRIGLLEEPFLTNILQSFFDAGVIAESTTELNDNNGDMIFQFTVTTIPTVSTMIVYFRYRDPNDFYSVEITTAGDLVLKETIDGSATTIDTAAAVLSGGELITIIADEEDIRGYYDNTLAWTYTSATFAAERGVEVQSLGGDGVITRWEGYRRFFGLVESNLINDFADIDRNTNVTTDDRFTTDASTFDATREAEPGPGTWTVTDSNDNLSISDSELFMTTTVTSGADPSLIESAVTREFGKVLLVEYRMDSLNHVPLFGFSDSASPTSFANYVSGLRINIGRGVTVSYTTAPLFASNLVTDDTIKAAIILTRLGAYYLLNINDLGWELVWVDEKDSTSTLYPALGTHASGSHYIKYAKVAQLPAPYNDPDALLVFNKSGQISAGDTEDTGSGDFFMQFTEDTLPGSGNEFISFREQDTNNKWQIDIESNGTLGLVETVSGTPTTQASVATVVNNGDTIKIVAIDETIKIYTGGLLRIEYTSAVNFKTETTSTVDDLGSGSEAAVADWKCWQASIDTGLENFLLDELAVD